MSSAATRRLLPIDAAKVDALIAKYPFYTRTVIPAGTYAGFDEDILTVSVMSMLVASNKVDEQLGYAIARALFSHLDQLQAAQPGVTLAAPPLPLP